MRLLLRTGKPVTRENYIKLNWLGEAPRPLPSELEDDLPPELQENVK